MPQSCWKNLSKQSKLSSIKIENFKPTIGRTTLVYNRAYHSGRKAGQAKEICGFATKVHFESSRMAHKAQSQAQRSSGARSIYELIAIANVEQT